MSETSDVVDLGGLAVVLGPVPPVGPGSAAITAPSWETPPRVPTGAATVVWGSAPFPPGATVRQVAAAALRRQGAVLRLRVRPPPGMAVRAVHPLAPAAFTLGLRGRVRARLLQGVLVELARDPAAPRVLDLVAAAAGATSDVRAFTIGSGGTLLTRVRVDGESVVLRVAVQGSAGDPDSGVAALLTLRHPAVPQLLGSGVLAGASWTAEQLLPGHRPVGLTKQLLSDVATFCAGLPRDGQRASAARDLASIGQVLPRFTQHLDDVAARVAPPLLALPSVARHGDLWSGNLLANAGRLSGVIDWDAWAAGAVPGTDLLHLVTTEHRLAGSRALGDVFLDRPWRRPGFTAVAADYWDALGVRPESEVLDAVGVAWWAAQVGADLRRSPHLAHDVSWTRANVDQVLATVTVRD